MSIDVRNIRKTFGHFTALHDVNLNVPDGQLVALLGPSGSGKTTLLRIIAGLETPDSGAIEFDGKDVARHPVGQRRVGFVFQHYALFRHMTVAQNIAFGLRVRPWRQRPPRSQIRQKVRELLKLIQLENLEVRFPSQLSGGQRQRVALARALAIEPKVLLLDEPFGALDAKVRQGLRRWLRRLHDEIHVTSVFVTHDQEEALEVADRVVVMNEGRIEQVGTPDEVFHHPANAFVMEFLGNVNLFRGRVESGKVVAGPLEWSHADAQAAEGAPAHLFVRPHELDIQTHLNGQPAVRARVRHVNSAGPLVRVELQDDQSQAITVELSHDRFRELKLATESEVFVTLRGGRVFVDDYSI